LGKLFGSVLM